MKYRRLELSAVLFLGLGLTGLQAQESAGSTGGDASGSGGSASYSLGQVGYSTHAGTNGSVSEGVQQPYEISIVSAVDQAKGISLQVTAYPNPASEYLTLRIDDFDISNLSYHLYNVKGDLLKIEKITGNLISIEMHDYVPASYFVKIIRDNQEVKTFKIIKQ